MLLNADHPDVTLGSVLQNLKKFTAGFDPMVGLQCNLCHLHTHTRHAHTVLSLTAMLLIHLTHSSSLPGHYQDKGLSITNAGEIRKVHNSFARWVFTRSGILETVTVV